METIQQKTITQYECSECENWFVPQSFNYNPPCLELQCDGCDRIVEIEADELTVVRL